MAEMVDAPDQGSGPARGEGSSPSRSTINIYMKDNIYNELIGDILYLRNGECIFDKNICIYSNNDRGINSKNDNISKIEINKINTIFINPINSVFVIITNDNNIYEIKGEKTYSINEIISENIFKIFFTCTEEKFKNFDLIKNGCNYAEIGVRFGFSTNSILKYCNDNNI